MTHELGLYLTGTGSLKWTTNKRGRLLKWTTNNWVRILDRVTSHKLKQGLDIKRTSSHQERSQQGQASTVEIQLVTRTGYRTGASH